MSDLDRGRTGLPEATSWWTFHNEIIPGELARGVPQQQPVVVFVLGQPGAGTTGTAATVKQQLDGRGGAVLVNPDFYRPYHPGYGRQEGIGGTAATTDVVADTARWATFAEQYLIDRRVDVVVETAVRDPAEFAEAAARFRTAGYRVEAAILAVPAPLSRLSNVRRYHEQVQQLGSGELTTASDHDASYYGVAVIAEVIDRDRIVDAATVYRPGNIQLVVNFLDQDGQWHWPNRSIAQSVDAERRRAWSPAEAGQFTSAVARLADEMGPAWSRELHEVASLAVPLATTTGTDPKQAGVAALGFPRDTHDALRSLAGSQVESPRPASVPRIDQTREVAR